MTIGKKGGNISLVIKKGKLKDNYIKIHNPNKHLKEVKKDG